MILVVILIDVDGGSTLLENLSHGQSAISVLLELTSNLKVLFCLPGLSESKPNEGCFDLENEVEAHKQDIN